MSDTRSSLGRPRFVGAAVATVMGLGWKCEMDPRRNI